MSDPASLPNPGDPGLPGSLSVGRGELEEALQALLVEAVRPLAEQTPAPDPGMPDPSRSQLSPAGGETPLPAEGLMEMLRSQATGASRVESLAKAFPGAATAEALLPEALARLAGEPSDPTGFLRELAAGIPAPAADASTSRFYFLPAAAASGPPAAAFDIEAVRRDFPALNQRVHGKPLIWLDNAATTQKPRAVIDAVSRFYERDNSNVHRGAHTLAVRAAEAYEEARRKVQKFLGASSPNECVFVRGTTEGINLVAQAFGRENIGHGDEIVLTTLEHHSNIVPWQMLAKEKCAVLRVVPITDSGEVLLDEVAKLIGPRTKIVAVSHVSNVLGTILPVQPIAELAHRQGARVLIDGAQAVAHIPVNVQQLDADFYVFSGHKLFAPTGVGVLYAKEELLRAMPPWQGGGNMIRKVSFEETTYNDPPAKFEAGTGVMGEAVGLGAAIDYVSRIGLEAMAAYEGALTSYAMGLLSTVPGLRMIGTVPDKVGVLSFILDGVPSEEVGRKLDLEGIAVRAGHHCAQPTMARYGVPSMVRPSLAFYNTPQEIDALVQALHTIRR